MGRILIFAILFLFTASCDNQDLLTLKVSDIKEPCECIDYSVEIAKKLEQLEPYPEPNPDDLWDCGEYYVESSATDEEKILRKYFSKRMEIHLYCIEKFNHNLLNKCATDHVDLLGVDSLSYLGYAKHCYSFE